jgi:sugar lactone lactonase YvrE
MKMRSVILALAALIMMCSSSAALAQSKAKAENVPVIPHEVRPFLKMPPGLYLGEVMGVATNSKGHLYVFTRSANTRLFEFDQNGTYVREIGAGSYAMEFAHSVRVDPQDNVWIVDEGTNLVVKFSPAGKVLMVLGHRPDAVAGAVATPTGPTPPAQKYTFGRPSDVAWDSQGNIFVTDGYVNHRVVKYDKDGRFLAQVGSEKPGSAVGELNLPHGLSVDLAGNVYVADRTNTRMQVFDNNLKPKAVYDNIGDSWSTCVSPGPHQYLFTSNSNPNGNAPGTWETTGEIYKMELDGRIIGKFGHAGKGPGAFQVVHMMDCRNPNEIIVSEIESWRVQKITLKP